MQDRDPVGKSGPETPDQLGGEGDFRNEHQYLFLPLEDHGGGP